MNKEYHVSVNGNDSNIGSLEAPFCTISKAAQVAVAGDTVTVHEGVYREWVRPAHGGESNEKRIVYRAAEGEKVVIKGSEVISNWEALGDGVWKAALPNEMFGDYNPYEQAVEGDWMLRPRNRSGTQARCIEMERLYMRCLAWRKSGRSQRHGMRKYRMIPPSSMQILERTIPNEALTEINVRKCCFYPEKIGLNYITVRGFEIAQAASPWAPPDGRAVWYAGSTLE